MRNTTKLTLSIIPLILAFAQTVDALNKRIRFHVNCDFVISRFWFRGFCKMGELVFFSKNLNDELLIFIEIELIKRIRIFIYSNNFFKTFLLLLFNQLSIFKTMKMQPDTANLHFARKFPFLHTNKNSIIMEPLGVREGHLSPPLHDLAFRTFSTIVANELGEIHSWATTIHANLMVIQLVFVGFFLNWV